MGAFKKEVKHKLDEACFDEAYKELERILELQRQSETELEVAASTYEEYEQ